MQIKIIKNFAYYVKCMSSLQDEFFNKQKILHCCYRQKNCEVYTDSSWKMWLDKEISKMSNNDC